MAARSGMITVTTAGTAVAGPATPVGRMFRLTAHPDNTDTVWVGNDGAGDVSSANGSPLNARDSVIVEVVRSLDELYFDADVSGEKIAWLAVAL